MRFPRLRIRLTVRRLMVVVLASTLPIWWFVGRPAWFERLAERHREQYRATFTDYKVQYGNKSIVVSDTTMMGEWHLIMSLRYREAARNYWMPLGPDPRMPRDGDVIICEPFDQHHLWHFGTREELQKVLIERDRKSRSKASI